MANIDVSISETLVITESTTNETAQFKGHYGTIAQANRYFSEVIYGELWIVTPEAKLKKALITATKMIDNLQFAGWKAVDTQPLEFPRGLQTSTPQDIEEATYELGLALLRGVVADTEYANTFVSKRQFGDVRTDYGYGSQAPEHIVAGIPSTNAWSKLRPYLGNNLGLKLSRGA